MLKRQGELHELDRKRLQREIEEKTVEWQKLAKEAVTVGKELGARLQETRARFEGVFSDLADAMFVVALVLSYEEPRRRYLLLSTLSLRAQRLVRSAMEALPPPTTESVPGLGAALLELRGATLGQILSPLPQSMPPPPPRVVPPPFSPEDPTRPLPPNPFVDQ